MKTTLFCKNPYAFGILKPISDELISRNHSVKWFIPSNIKEKFPYKNECDFTINIQEIHEFNNDVIFVPGNEVPHYLRGLKVQIFHGLAGEKKGHFRIRKYFDLYLTQGPYFTNRFKMLAKKYQDFDVIETGWPKLDQLFSQKNLYQIEKTELKKKYSVNKIILYAPTFSPSLTSAIDLKDTILTLANTETLLLIKFHDLMDNKVVSEYKSLCRRIPNAEVVDESNIIKYLILSDLMISDTSSVVYEFLLLNKPVITYKSKSKNIKWENITNPKQLITSVNNTFIEDKFKDQRSWIIKNYHPYTDGKSSKRMVDAVEKYIKENPIPEYRKLPWSRKRKMIKMFGNVTKKV
ncbi:MAG: CDP-glycerol glycerophosphotransferase family protein [Bacteroidota bacterium]|nr:CDP-glycerol glycerophosphotransferase family protein [Bacteroidota bacterium]